MARFLITIEDEVLDEKSSLSDDKCQNDPGMLKSLTGFFPQILFTISKMAINIIQVKS